MVTALTAIRRDAVAAEKTANPEIGVMLEVMVSDKCIDNAGSRKRDASLQGWKCNSRNLNQRYAVTWRGKKAGIAAIRNKLSRLCLDVQRKSKKDGARIVQNRCGDSQSQRWQFMKSGKNKWFQIQARHSGMCLTLARTGKDDSFLIQSKCNKRDDSQKFRLRT